MDLPENVSSQLQDIRASIGAQVTTPDAPKKDAPKAEPDPMAATYAANKGDVEKAVASGALMKIEPRHTDNYDELVAGAARQGYSKVDIMLDVSDGKHPTKLYKPSGEGEATLQVTQAALKPTAAFETDVTDHKVKNGQYPVLTPELAANYAELAGAAGEGHTPRVVLGNLYDDEKTRTPAAVKVVAPAAADGQPTVVANYNAVEITPAFAEKHLMATDADVARRVESGRYEPAENAGMPKEVVNGLKASGTPDKPAPALYVDYGSDAQTPHAATFATKEGHQVVVVNERALDMPVAAQQAELRHERAHQELGHNTVQGIVSEHNQARLLADPDSVQRKRESDADQLAICSAPDPKQAANNAITWHRFDDEAVAQFLKKDRNIPIDEAREKAATDAGDHPSSRDRVAAAQKLAEECPAPLPTPGSGSSVRAR